MGCQIRFLCGREKAEILAADQVTRIHEATLTVLARTGVNMWSPRALHILREAGAQVDEAGMRVRFPSQLVEEALRRAPRSYVLAARDPQQDLPLDGEHSYLCLDGCAPELIDLETGRCRPSTKADLAAATRVADALPEIAFVWQVLAARDITPPLQPLHELEAQFANTGKHIQVMTTTTPQAAHLVLEMAALVAGGKQALRRRPLISTFQCSLSPLCYEEGALDAALVFAEAGVPSGFVAMPIACATSPATLAGTLVVTNAEVLAGIVTLQTAVPGAPTFYGACPTVIDLRSGAAACGGPEDVLLQMAAAQMARWYGIPSSIGTFACGAKWPNWQAGVENTLSGLASCLAGADMLCGAGLVHGARVFSYEQLLLDTEIFGLLRHMAGGIPVGDEESAVAAVESVGPGGHFLAHVHTLRHMRRIWNPRMFDRRSWEEWETAGRPEPAEAARERARELLCHHSPLPLEPGMKEEISRLTKAYEAKLRL